MNDRRVPSGVDEELVWECSEESCLHVVRSSRPPPNHEDHPDRKMVLLR